MKLSTMDSPGRDMGYVPPPLPPSLYSASSSYSSWKKWFAWHPVTVNGRRVWLKTVYRQSRLKAEMDGMGIGWVYGDIFDVLKEYPDKTPTFAQAATKAPPMPPPRKP